MRQHAITGGLLAILVGLFSTPAMAQNLITNPIFENLGFGSIPSNWTFAPGDQAVNSTIWGPGPGPMSGQEKADGNWTIAGTNYASIQSGDEVQLWTARQVISVTPGNQYRFAGWYGGGATAHTAPANTATLFVRVLDGSGLGGSVLTAANVQIRGANTGFGWREFERHFTAATSQVTVVFGWESNFAWEARGVHVDDLSLVAEAACPTQHELTGLSGSTSVEQGNNVTGVIINGSNLDNATGVKLVWTGPGAPTEFVGTITNQTASQITADFPTSTASLGFYDVVVEQSGCTERYLPLAFEVQVPAACLNVSFNTVGNDRGVSGDSLHTIELGGDNLDASMVNSINLVKTNQAGGNVAPFSVTGTNIRDSGASPNTILVDFDLSTNPEAGRYGVQVDVTHPCGPSFVNVVGGFSNGFLMALPANLTLGPNGHILLVHNHSFEQGYVTPDNGGPFCDPSYSFNNPKPLHWEQHMPVTVGTWSRDHDLGFGAGNDPANCWRVALRDGDHYADQTHSNETGPRTVSFFQTVEISDLLDNEGNLAEALTVRARLATHASGAPEAMETFIDLIDGVEFAPAQLFSSDPIATPAEFEFKADPTYQATIPAGTPWQTNPPMLTVRFRASKQATSNPEFTIMRVDFVHTGPFIDPTCNDPFADADGDGDVDQDDFAVFQRCLSDFDDNPYCQCFDRESPSGELGSADLIEFANCFTGPTILHADNPNPNCADQP